MLTKEKIDIISREATQNIKSLLGEKLHKIIMYGSCARGDFNEESDVDIMVLADVERDELYPFEDKLCAISSDLGLEHDTVVSIYLKNNDFFNKILPELPFYQNVVREGVELYGS